MLKRLKHFLAHRIKHNTFIYVIPILFFILGIFIGGFWVDFLPGEVKNILSSNFNDYFLLMPTYSFNSSIIFKTSFLSNIIPVIILFILSIKYMGLVFAPLYITFRGFSFGFSIAFLTESFGRKGLLFTLISMLPQNIIYIPALIFNCFISINLSLIMLRLRKERFKESKNKEIIKYMTYSFITIIALIIASFIEAYITPVFIKTITPYI